MKRPLVVFEDPLLFTCDKQQFGFEELMPQTKEPDVINATNGRLGVCRFFSKGYCIKGSECPHKHIRNDKAVVCKHWLRGLCKKGELCEFLHEYDMAKMPECYFFTQYGECSNDDCLYLHITNQQRESVCQFYNRGFCRHGGACRNRHDAKVLCENYELGFCPNGPNCDFGHPEFDGDTYRDNNMECHTCGKTGHRAAECPNKVFTCYQCNQPGHSARDCPENRGGGGGRRDTRK